MTLPRPATIRLKPLPLNEEPRPFSSQETRGGFNNPNLVRIIQTVEFLTGLQKTMTFASKTSNKTQRH